MASVDAVVFGDSNGVGGSSKNLKDKIQRSGSETSLTDSEIG